MKKLPKGSQVITCWATTERGPGWSNSPVWALVKVPGEEGYRIECLQLTDQTRNMVVLHRISNIVHNQMVKEAREVLLKKGG